MVTELVDQAVDMEEMKCHCGAVLGWVQVIGGVRFFTYGSGPIQSLTMVCKECGREFFWETNRKEFKRAMLRAFLKGNLPLADVE